MDKTHFKPDTRYLISWRGPDGRLQPAELYVFRAYDDFLVVRPSGPDARPRKIGYSEVAKIVAVKEVPPEGRYRLPAALLEEAFWREREVLEHHAGSPARGK